MHAQLADFDCDISGDEYSGIGACSVISENDSDFDDANQVGDCDVWDADPEMTEGLSPVGEPAKADGNPSTCLRKGSGRRQDDCRRVTFHHYCAREDNGVSAFCVWHSPEGVEWVDPVVERLPKKLVDRRVSEGLKADHTVRRLDVPLTTRPKPIKNEFFGSEEYLRKTHVRQVLLHRRCTRHVWASQPRPLPATSNRSPKGMPQVGRTPS